MGCPCGAALGQIPDFLGQICDSCTSMALFLGLLSWNSFPEKPCRFSDIWKFAKTSRCSTFPKIWRCLIKAASTQDKKLSGYDFICVSGVCICVSEVYICISEVFIYISGVYFY